MGPPADFLDWLGIYIVSYRGLAAALVVASEVAEFGNLPSDAAGIAVEDQPFVHCL